LEISFGIKDKMLYLQRRFKIFQLLDSSVYKKIIASFLLALYSFVCLPASAWHSHKKSVEKETTYFKNQTGCSFITTTDETSESNCKICAHQYQLHNNDAIEPFVPELILTGLEKISFEYSPLKTPVYIFFNKGPPVLI
jgi:hypothetical protein